MCEVGGGGRVHRAEVGESVFVEVEGALIEIKVVPSRSGVGKDIAVVVTNLNPNMGFTYIVDGHERGRSVGGSTAHDLVAITQHKPPDTGEATAEPENP
ncbi:hypothetical protein BH11PAT4_BH11PAT4_5500 [soil metagenome]